MAKIAAVCKSEKKGTRKKSVGSGRLIVDFGLEGDAHGGPWHRQVSLLAMESIEKMRAKGLDVYPGDFAENLTTEGIELFTLPIGTRLKIGPDAVGEVTQIGKECHHHCAIYQQAGDCVMPREGIFIKVIREGSVQEGDDLSILHTFRVGIITASDKGSKGEREDLSGPAIEELIVGIGGVVEAYAVVPDEQSQLADKMKEFADEKELDLILTTGGTGFSPRDVTPEATREVVDRLAPGIAEAMRLESLKMTPKAMLSRAIAGIRGRTLIVNMPGSPKAVRECLQVIMPALPHGIEILRGEASECARK